MTLENATTALAAAVLPTVVTSGIGWLIKNAFGSMKAVISDLVKEVKDLGAKLNGHDTRIETALVRLGALEKEQERQANRYDELATKFQKLLMGRGMVE